jgi:hypothetical protein
METEEELNIQPEEKENANTQEYYVRKFRSFSRDFFDVDLSKMKNEPMARVKEASQLMNYGLPANFNEIFLRSDEAHLLWVISSPLNSYLEDYFKMNYSKASGLELIRSCNETFQKWVFNKSVSEKKYFANSFMNIADKKFSNNFWPFLLISTLYLNENSLTDYGKVIEYITKASEAIQNTKLSDSSRVELSYYINIIKGYANLGLGDATLANECFSEAIRINPFGITGKFYLALVEALSSNNEIAQHLLSEILNFDFYRCGHAVNSYNAGMLSFFVRFPVTKNIFYYDEFALLAEPLEEELLKVRNNYFNGYSILNDKLVKLDALKMEEYYSGETTKIIRFISQTIEILGGNKSILFYKVFPDIEAKFSQAIENIKNAVNEKYMGEIKNRLAYLISKIDDYKKDLESIKMEQDEYLQKLKVRYKEAQDRLDKETSAKISEIEALINNIGNLNRLSPRHTFNRSMAYNIIVSVLVFMMGGCSGYTDSFMYNVYEFKEVLSIILIAGLKWGGIAFFTGILICFFIAGYVVMERANEKQKLIKRISQVKEHKKNELDSLKKDYELSEKTINNNFQRRVNEKNEDIRLIEEQKARKEKEYTEEAQAKINEELKKLEVVCEAKEMADVEKDAA